MPPLKPSSSSSGEDSSSDDEQLSAPAINSQAPKSEPKNAEEEEEEGSSSESIEGDEESDGEEEEETSDNEEQERSRLVNPTPSNPASESESGDSDSPAQFVVPVSSKPMKRQTTNAESKSPNGNSFFQRVWSIDDEIAILKGMEELSDKRGPIKWNKDAVKDLYSLVAKSLSIDATESKLYDKMRKLKLKYMTFVRKRKDPKLATGRDRTFYELAHKVWGNEEVLKNANGNGVMKGRGKNSNGNRVMENVREKNLKRSFPLTNDVALAMVGNSFAELGLEKINPEEAAALETALKKARRMEIKHHMHRLELLKKTFELVEGGIKRSIV